MSISLSVSNVVLFHLDQNQNKKTDQLEEIKETNEDKESSIAEKFNSLRLDDCNSNDQNNKECKVEISLHQYSPK